MPPIVILIRHGEAQHNATRDYTIPDPPLTLLGEQQCRQLEQHLRQNVDLADKIQAIITSPFTRTLQTTEIGLDWLIKRGVRVEVDAAWQENSDKPCDTGSKVDAIRPAFPDIDFSTLDPVFPSKAKDTIYAFTRTAVTVRGQLCLRNLYTRSEKVVAVVSHSAFLRTAVSRRQYANADFRVFTFADRKGDDPLRLIEDASTAGKGGMGQSEPEEVVIESWEFPSEP